MKIQNKNYKISKRFLEKAQWYLNLTENKTFKTEFYSHLFPPVSNIGYTGLECFWAKESLGLTLPCREPLIYVAYQEGKWLHGVTVETVANSFIERLEFSLDIKTNYPPWVANEIFSLAKKLVFTKLGWIPPFIENQKDFTEYTQEEIVSQFFSLF